MQPSILHHSVVNDPAAPVDAVVMAVTAAEDMTVEVTIVVALLPLLLVVVMVADLMQNAPRLVILLSIGNIQLYPDEMTRILHVMLLEGRNMFRREGLALGMRTAPQGGRLLMPLSREGVAREMTIAGVIDDLPSPLEGIIDLFDSVWN
jgi:hypothetical protein